MTPLQSLKQMLQEHLEMCREGDDYKAAIDDCIYSCSLGELALNQHIIWWGAEEGIESTQDWGDTEYERGVDYVYNQWKTIKEKEDERLF